MFRGYIYRDSSFFRGILEIIQEGSIFFFLQYRQTSRMCDGFENLYKSFIDTINVIPHVPPKYRNYVELNIHVR